METHYLQGFNEGYLISRHIPDLAREINTINSNLPRLVGFRDGFRQFVLEQLRDMQPKWMQRTDQEISQKSPNKDKDIVQDR